MADPVSTALSLAQLIVPSVEPVIRRLIEERRERKQMEKGLEKEIQRLFSNMEDLKNLLHDADKKQYQSESLRTWLMKLKEVVSDADDVLDEYATDLAISQIEGGSQLLNPDGWKVKLSVVQRVARLPHQLHKKFQNIAQTGIDDNVFRLHMPQDSLRDHYGPKTNYITSESN